MKLSIIIVHYKNPAVLKLCLKSIFDSKTTVEYEVIVIDSQSTGKLRYLIHDEFPQVTLIEQKENTGYARGVNIGLKEAKGEFVLILNYDTIVTLRALDMMVEFMEKHSDVGLLGPQLLNFDDSVQKSYFRYYTPTTIIARRLWLGKRNRFKKLVDTFLMNDTDPKQIQAPDWLMGAALMVSRKAIDTVGLMDENFFFYFEDVDWAKRFWQNRYKVIYFPDAKIYHSYGRGSKSNLGIFDIFFNKKTRWHLKSALRFFWKYRHKVVTINTK